MNDQPSASSFQSKSGDFLCQEGVVSSIGALDPQQGEVTINSVSACSTCHAKGHCTTLDHQEKELSVRFLYSGALVGDRVKVMLHQQHGWQALVIAIVVPLLLFMGTLIGGHFGLGLSETSAALFALASLVPYYLLLRLFRDRMQKRFVIYAQKIDS